MLTKFRVYDIIWPLYCDQRYFPNSCEMSIEVKDGWLALDHENVLHDALFDKYDVWPDFFNFDQLDNLPE